jgi:hypothetical protein
MNEMVSTYTIITPPGWYQSIVVLRMSCNELDLYPGFVDVQARSVFCESYLAKSWNSPSKSHMELAAQPVAIPEAYLEPIPEIPTFQAFEPIKPNLKSCFEAPPPKP